MKKVITFIFLFIAISSIAQQAQIARVSSTGVTTIYTDLKQAIWNSQDDDIIYLPGATFSADSIGIKKRIHLIGTGHYPDSTLASGLTHLSTNIWFLSGSTGASVQGLKTNNVYVADLINSTISMLKCNLTGIVGYGGYDVINCTFNIKESVFQSVDGRGAMKYNIEKCFILSNSIGDGTGNAYSLYALENSTVKYCIFPSNGINLIFNSTIISNNIFYGPIGGGANLSSFYYNLFTTSTSVTTSFGGNNIEYGNVAEGTFNNTFINVTAAGFNYSFDYHLKNTSVGQIVPGGVGVYAASNPYNPNPYNPHIYFKQIDPATNAQGQLKINAKVKAQ